MTVKFHFHHWHGRECCHIYSTDGMADLMEWGRRNGWPAEWLHIPNAGFPHFDAWGCRLEKCERPGVTAAEIVADYKAWSARLSTWRCGRCRYTWKSEGEPFTCPKCRASRPTLVPKEEIDGRQAVESL